MQLISKYARIILQCLKNTTEAIILGILSKKNMNFSSYWHRKGYCWIPTQNIFYDTDIEKVPVEF